MVGGWRKIVASSVMAIFGDDLGRQFSFEINESILEQVGKVRCSEFLLWGNG